MVSQRPQRACWRFSFNDGGQRQSGIIPHEGRPQAHHNRHQPSSLSFMRRMMPRSAGIARSSPHNGARSVLAARRRNHQAFQSSDCPGTTAFFPGTRYSARRRDATRSSLARDLPYALPPILFHTSVATVIPSGFTYNASLSNVMSYFPPFKKISLQRTLSHGASIWPRTW